MIVRINGGIEREINESHFLFDEAKEKEERGIFIRKREA